MEHKSVFNAIAMLALVACASPGLPPGGPERHTPPEITRIQPDTNSVGVRGKEFVIHFDEVVAERPAGAPKLSDIVLISPRNGAPVADWHRSSISIRPRKGWLPNTAYTVTLLPGLADLRGNVRTTPTVVTFSTGPSIPKTSIRGTLFDWMSGVPGATGMIEARSEADTSVVYVTATDSVGHYRLVGLPVAYYRVRGYPDQNHDRAQNPGDPYDSTRVYLADSLNIELLAFVHDSTGPKLGNASVQDSVTLRATFSTPLGPRTPLDPAHFALIAPDSSRVAILSVAAVHADTTHAAPPPPPRVPQSAIPVPQRTVVKPVLVLPKPTRPLLVRDVTIVIAKPLQAGATYTLRAIDATGPTGHKLSSDVTVSVPKPAPASDKTGAPAKPATATPASPARLPPTSVPPASVPPTRLVRPVR